MVGVPVDAETETETAATSDISSTSAKLLSRFLAHIVSLQYHELSTSQIVTFTVVHFEYHDALVILRQPTKMSSEWCRLHERVERRHGLLASGCYRWYHISTVELRARKQLWTTTITRLNTSVEGQQGWTFGWQEFAQ